MPYSSAQQAKLDQAKAQLDSATSARDSAYNDMSSYYDSYMVNCKYKWSMPAKGQPWETAGCDGAVNANNHPGCGSKSTCESRVNEFNAKVGVYNSAVSAYNTAKTNYDTVLQAVTIELQNDPELQGQIAQNITEAKGENVINIIKWVIFGLSALLLIGGFVYFRWIRPKTGN